MKKEAALKILHSKLDEKSKYNHAISLMHWDLETQIPKNAIMNRSEVIGFFSKKVYELSNSDELKNALNILNKNLDKLSNIDKRIVYLISEEQRKLSKIPKDEYVEYTMLVSKAQNIWAEAREKNDFKLFAPYLEKIITYQKKYINYIGYKNHPYDVLINDYEEGMTVDKLNPFFENLKNKIVPLLEKIKQKPQVNLSSIQKPYDIEKQKQLSNLLAKKLGFNFESGVLKESSHPFTLNFNKYDVRMTSRYMEDLFTSSIYSTIHEAGHAIYEQNIGEDIYNTILGTGVTLGIHESQSRFYENLIGKNQNFLQNIYPQIQELFPENLKNISIDEFYNAINNVDTTFIRVEADELTYPLHILIRYEMEKEIFENDINVYDLPKLWNEKYEKYLGITPSNYAEGILQDVHWSAGLFGYFPTYALGTVYASQIFNTINKKLNVKEILQSGNTKPILKFLVDNIHKYGSLKTADEIIFNLSNEYLNSKYYIDYLERKFSEIYNL